MYDEAEEDPRAELLAHQTVCLEQAEELLVEIRDDPDLDLDPDLRWKLEALLARMRDSG